VTWGPGARDRRDQEGRSQRQRHRRRGEDHRGHCPVHGHHRQVSSSTAGRGRASSGPPTTTQRNRLEDRMSKNSKAYREAAEKNRPRQSLHPARGHEAGQGDVVEEAGRHRRGCIRLGVDPARPTRWSAARSTCPTAPARPPASSVFAVGEKAEAALAAGADEVAATT